jgi:hypothetical protein
MDQCSCSIGRVLQAHSIGPLSDPSIAQSNDYLADLWTGRRGDEHSVREITDWLNEQILISVYQENGRDVGTNRIEHDYEVLTGEDETARETLETNLERDGIDTEELHKTMVTSSSVHRHLSECLGVEKGDQEPKGSDLEYHLDRVGYTRSTLANQVAEALELLDDEDAIAAASDAGISVDIKIKCPDCGISVDLKTALHRGYICGEHYPAIDNRGDVNPALIELID